MKALLLSTLLLVGGCSVWHEVCPAPLPPPKAVVVGPPTCAAEATITPSPAKRFTVEQLGDYARQLAEDGAAAVRERDACAALYLKLRQSVR